MNYHKLLFSLSILLFLVPRAFAQFGPIGFDFQDPYVEFEGLQFGIRLSTTSNIYCPDAISHTVERPSTNECILKTDLLSAAGGQLHSGGMLELQLKKVREGRIEITAKGIHPTELVKSILVLVKGIEVNTMISEYAQAKGVKPFDQHGTIRVSYPSRAATMPLAFLKSEQAEWFVLSKDQEVRRKSFAVTWDHMNQETVVLLAHEEDARKRSNTIAAPKWILGKNHKRLEVVQERCQDLEQHFGLIPHTKKPHSAWIDSLKMVAFFHGVHWTGHIFNTYDQMGAQLEWICKQMPGKQLMAFLPAWDGRYYVTYPEHEPDKRMGGKAGLKRLVEKADALGVKVILMYGGPNLSTFEFLRKHDMMDAGLKNPEGMPQVQNWLDWNIDLSIETMGLIMNFGHPQYRQYMIDKTAELFDTYDVDGVFLDGTLRWDNAPDYSPYEGLVQYTSEMRKRYPDKLIMGEDGYDVVYGLFDLFHTSAGPLGLENFLLRYTRQFYYLSYPAESGSSGVHEIGWSQESHTINEANPDFTIPSVSLFYGDVEEYGGKLKEKIKKYKNWQMKSTAILKD